MGPKMGILSRYKADPKISISPKSRENIPKNKKCEKSPKMPIFTQNGAKWAKNDPKRAIFGPEGPKKAG